MKVIIWLNFIISLIFTLCYFYQAVYVFIGLFSKSKKFIAQKNHRYAVIISARNESSVIQNLIDSIHNQTYPSELIDIFVVADNCTDNTAQIAEQSGATVYERFNNELVGKGYALDWLFERINADYGSDKFDAFIVFDADNIVAPTFIEEMNKVYDNGYRIITSYRNSKNYGKNWITAGYSLWFLREAKFLNNARMKLGTSCAISGTGFLIDADIIKENNGWIHHLLTEDIEFTTDSIIKGEKIGYCQEAVLYDEQPETFKQSYRQRLRWSKGFYQVFAKYSHRLLKGIFKGSFSCYDMMMVIAPAMLLTLVSTMINIAAVPLGFIFEISNLWMLIRTLIQTLFGFYMIFFVLGLLTTISEWDQIHCPKFKKILYTFTFPLFMFTYVPISIIALFKKVKWDPITHSISKNIGEMFENTNV